MADARGVASLSPARDDGLRSERVPVVVISHTLPNVFRLQIVALLCIVGAKSPKTHPVISIARKLSNIWSVPRMTPNA